MKTLLEGYKRFRATTWPKQKILFETLAEQGQDPRALVIACVDSRAPPTVIFDAPPGEILTVRNVANLVSPYEPDGMRHGTSAALEFGVRVLNVPNIVVLGHSLCGGIRTLLQGAPDNAMDFVAPWMSIGEHAKAKALQCDEPQEQQKCCEQESVKTSLENLLTYPWIREKVEAQTLRLYGTWFSVFTGELLIVNNNGQFVPANEFSLSLNEA